MDMFNEETNYIKSLIVTNQKGGKPAGGGSNRAAPV